MSLSLNNVVISGTGLYTPQFSISNDELVHSFNGYVDSYNETHKEAIEKGTMAPLDYSSSEFIEKASGIKSRYVMNKEGILDIDRMSPMISERGDDEHSVQCEMAIHAIEAALNNAKKSLSEVDAVIVACSNMQRAYPAVSIEIQTALGIKGFAFDMNVACSSATFGIEMASNTIKAGSAQCVLVVSPEICSGHLNFKDRDSHFIFGDVCTAIVLENEATAKAPGFKLIDARLQTEFSNNIRNNFGFLNRSEHSGDELPKEKLFKQNGRKVFKEVVPMVSELIKQQLSDNDFEQSDIKRLWLHQANINMNQLITKKVVGVEPSDSISPTILDEFANTSSAGSIIAFHRYQQNLKAGDVGVICSFGAGYSVGSVLLQKQ